MKSMKKLVLVGLVLLASVVVLAGCKMEPEGPKHTVDPVTFDSPNGTRFYYDETVTVALSSNTEGATIQYKLNSEDWQDYSEEITVTSDTTITAKATKEGLKDSDESTASYTVRKLTAISISPQTQTVYSEDESFDSTVVLTATYDDGEERPVEGTITSETSSLTESAGINKEVTVIYTEDEITKEATFTIDVASYKFTETVQNYEYPEGKTGTASAQSIPAVANPLYKIFGDWPQTSKGEGVDIGSGTLTRGDLIYQVGSDGNYYVQAGNDYYKVEPIVWRVLNKDYASTGTALLLAEKILTGGIQWDDDKNNYMKSRIRKWLNGNSGSGEQSDYSGDAGFLQTAFTSEAQGLITPTTVDNSARSTNPESDATKWDSGENEYACKNTTDKIFLLSEQEATKEAYGFAEYNKMVEGNTRIRVTTGYAKATGAYQDSGAGYGGSWWLRSPFYYYHVDYGLRAYGIDYDGGANSSSIVSFEKMGIVPALYIQLQ